MNSNIRNPGRVGSDAMPGANDPFTNNGMNARVRRVTRGLPEQVRKTMQAKMLEQTDPSMSRSDIAYQEKKNPAPYKGRRQKSQMNTMLGQLMGDYATDLANGRDLLGTTTLLGS